MVFLLSSGRSPLCHFSVSIHLWCGCLSDLEYSYTSETKRILGVLDKYLDGREWLVLSHFCYLLFH